MNIPIFSRLYYNTQSSKANAPMSAASNSVKFSRVNAPISAASNLVNQLACSPDRMLCVSFKGLDYEDGDVRSALYAFESLMHIQIGRTVEFKSLEEAIQTLNLKRGSDDPKFESYNYFFRNASDPKRIETYEWHPKKEQSGGYMEIVAMRYEEEPILTESHISPSEKLEALQNAGVELPINKYDFIRKYEDIRDTLYRTTDSNKYGAPAEITYRAVDDEEISVKIIGADTEEDTAHIMGLKKTEYSDSENYWIAPNKILYSYVWNPETKSMVRKIFKELYEKML